jgi:hypothetical protein
MDRKPGKSIYRDRAALWAGWSISFALMCLGAVACGGGGSSASALPIPSPTPVPPAIANQNARSTTVTTDFLRLLYVPAGLPAPTGLGLPPKKHVFLQASQFLVPPLTVLQDITFPGLTDAPDQILYAIRCQPAAGSGADPILATWPNVFQAIVEDFAANHFACPAPPGATGENQAYCDALGYVVRRNSMPTRHCSTRSTWALNCFKSRFPRRRRQPGPNPFRRNIMLHIRPSPGWVSRSQAAAITIC